VFAVAAGHLHTASLRKYPEPVWRAAARTVPLQRLGREEHAWLVALCCSPLGAALSGSGVILDGAHDNWFGPWPPPSLAAEGGDPDRGPRAEASQVATARGIIRTSAAGEVLWLHRSLPSF
jgi:citronellol/citronellal dehydrogenase